VSLQYNVATLLREPIGAVREYEIEDRALVNEEGPETRSVSGQVTFLRTNEGILVSAAITGIEQERCSRCLREIELPVALEFQEVFYPTTDLATGVRLARPEDPDAFRVDERQMLDLEEPIRQFWTVALPMQPLCQPDCRGLCPQCGQDWNEGTCECVPPTDERWSALQELRK
jgi:uncharacterized protein